MSFNCLHTGAVIFLQEYGTYWRGDIFQQEIIGAEHSNFVLRLTNTPYNQDVPDEACSIINLTVFVIGHWFRDLPYSTLITDNVGYYGYEGIPVDVKG